MEQQVIDFQIPLNWYFSLFGGVLIGLSATLVLFFLGRVTGISGMLFDTYFGSLRVNRWRLSFIIGLLIGGFLLSEMQPGFFAGTVSLSSGWTLLAGLLVGFGTSLGSGCTSGHGVCGISRLSPRSMLSTLLFTLAGMLSVAIFRHFGVLP